MKNLHLFVAPNTCARVPTIALEEIGVPFETTLIRVATGEQNTPEFLKHNPKGKVPALLVDGAPLTENVAILNWLNVTFPHAHLLPAASDALDASRHTADLAFFAGSVHPVVTRIAMPMKLVPDAAQSFETVRPMGTQEMHKIMTMIEARLDDGQWWYGETWSIVDGYLFWVWSRITGVGFDGSAYPNLQQHPALSYEPRDAV